LFQELALLLSFCAACPEEQKRRMGRTLVLKQFCWK